MGKKAKMGKFRGGVWMATKPRPWPNNAGWARDDVIALAQRGCELVEAYKTRTNDPELLRMFIELIDIFRDAENTLLSVGPKPDGAK